jgi:hypothetical protein
MEGGGEGVRVMLWVCERAEVCEAEDARVRERVR